MLLARHHSAGEITTPPGTTEAGRGTQLSLAPVISVKVAGIPVMSAECGKGWRYVTVATLLSVAVTTWQPHGPQHTRFPVFHYSAVCSDSCSLAGWWYLTIRSFLAFLHFCLLPSASGVSNESALMSYKTKSLLSFPGWFLFRLTGLCSGFSRVFANTVGPRTSLSLAYGPTHTTCTTGNHAWLYEILLAKDILLFNMLSVFVIFSSPSECLLMAAVTPQWFGAYKIACFHSFLCHAARDWDLVWMRFWPFSLSVFTPHQETLCSSSLCHYRESAYFREAVDTQIQWYSRLTQ